MPKIKEERKRVPVKKGRFHEADIPSDSSYLIGSKCKVCGDFFFPRRFICPNCLEENTTEEIPLSRTGKIYSYSVIHISIPGFKAPYIIGRIQLPEGPIVTSLVTGCEMIEGALEIGDEVELVIGKIDVNSEGDDIIGYMFRPIKREI